jgi:hypothetical protein
VSSTLPPVQLDRDPEPKIGHIAMALERRGEQTERVNFWRDVVARNPDRFSAWIALQRARLDALWERFEKGENDRGSENQREIRIGGKHKHQTRASRHVLHPSSVKGYLEGRAIRSRMCGLRMVSVRVVQSVLSYVRLQDR